MSVESIITENLDVWTSAIKNKSISGRGSSKKVELYGIEKLRELIIELAVRGKLLPQDSTDEPARVVLENIEAERALLGQNKKVKKFKPINKEFTQPHAIPMNWEFVQLEQIALFTGGFAFKSAQYVEEGTRVIRISDFDERGLKMENIVRYQYEPKLESFLLSKDDLLMAMTGGTVGKSLLLEKLPEPLLVNQRVAGIRLFSGIEPKYIKYVLQTKLIQNVISEAKNSTNDNISMGDIRGFLIPLPPMKHQRLLVLKIDELMSLCDQLESQTEASIEAHQTLVKSLLETLTNAIDSDELNESWQRISEHFDVLFTTEDSIDQLKQTILQLAVMGKLVKQDPNDEPASKLLERIAAEKEQLISDKKLKKPKAMKPFEELILPFEVPEEWCWLRLGDICHHVADGPHFSPKYVEKGEGVPFLSARNVTKSKIELSTAKYVSKSDHEDFCKRVKVEKGDILYTKGGTTGVAKVNDIDIEFSVWVHIAVLQIPQDKVFNEYIAIALNSPHCYTQSQNYTHGVGNKDLGLTRMINITVPFPPLPEQYRIVAKVLELMGLCEDLKSKLSLAKETQCHISDAFVMHTS